MMKRIDHHVHFELPYTIDNLLPYIERAKALNLEELHILDHSHRFIEFKPIYENGDLKSNIPLILQQVIKKGILL